MIRKFLLISSVTLFAVGHSHAQPGDFDLFPLMPGLKFSYQYYNHSKYIFVAYLESESLDSGRVEYLIEDSIHVHDTLVMWSIMQTEDLSCYRFGIGGDTTYRLQKDTRIYLSESLVGQHEVRCSSRVWLFPPNDSIGSIFRYSDVSPYAVAFNYDLVGCSICADFDSLSFVPHRGFRYRYRHKELHGISHSYTTMEIGEIGNPTDVSNDSKVIALTSPCGNFPNPFNASTTISYFLIQNANIELRVFDILGRQVLVSDLGYRRAGPNSYVLNTQELPSGIYLYQLQSTDSALMGKFVLTR